MPDPQRIQYTSSDGLELVAFSYGPNDAELTILCLHGLTRNHKDFEMMIAALDPRYRFIAVDVRGRGKSAYDPNPYNYTPLTYAFDVVTLLDKLELDKVVLIGTSMGGLMSMILMKSIPNRILGVVLNDIGPALKKRGIARIISYVGKTKPFENWGTAAASIAFYNETAFPDNTPEDWLLAAKRTCRETESGEIVFDYDPLIYKAFRMNRITFATTYLAWRLFDAMRAVPLLLIRGELSDLLSANDAKRMLRRHGNAKLLTLKNIGHAPMLDEPESVQEIGSFLRQFTET